MTVLWISFIIVVRVILALAFLSQYGDMNKYANLGHSAATISVGLKAIIFLALFIWSCESITLF
jgi:hypothetical protein